MSYILVWGYKNGLSNKKFLGIKPCGNCGKFSEMYLARSFYQINLFWFLPIFGFPTGRHLRCGNCNGTRKLTRAEWSEMKENARFMPKKKDYLRAYEELKALVIAAEPHELTTTTIYSRLLNKLDFTDDGGHIRELVDVYLRNSQNAATIAAKAAGETAVDVQPVEDAPQAAAADGGVTREAPAVQGYAAETYGIPAASGTAAVSSDTGSKKGSKLRLLWLIPAILLIPFALIFGIAAISVALEDPSDVAVNLIMLLMFIGIPVGLDILFFRLALKKK